MKWKHEWSTAIAVFLAAIILGAALFCLNGCDEINNYLGDGKCPLYVNWTQTDYETCTYHIVIYSSGCEKTLELIKWRWRDWEWNYMPVMVAGQAIEFDFVFPGADVYLLEAVGVAEGEEVAYFRDGLRVTCGKEPAEDLLLYATEDESRDCYNALLFLENAEPEERLYLYSGATESAMTLERIIMGSEWPPDGYGSKAKQKGFWYWQVIGEDGRESNLLKYTVPC